MTPVQRAEYDEASIEAEARLQLAEAEYHTRMSS